MNDNDDIPMIFIVMQSMGIVLTQLLDYGTTVIGLKNGAREMNGLMRFVIEDYGNTGFLVAKVGIGLAFAWFCRFKPAAAWAITLLTAGVAFWNLRIIYGLI